jgi:hypothetical protein
LLCGLVDGFSGLVFLFPPVIESGENTTTVANDFADSLKAEAVLGHTQKKVNTVYIKTPVSIQEEIDRIRDSNDWIVRPVGRERVSIPAINNQAIHEIPAALDRSGNNESKEEAFPSLRSGVSTIVTPATVEQTITYVIPAALDSSGNNESKEEAPPLTKDLISSILVPLTTVADISAGAMPENVMQLAVQANIIGFNAPALVIEKLPVTDSIVVQDEEYAVDALILMVNELSDVYDDEKTFKFVEKLNLFKNGKFSYPVDPENPIHSTVGVIKNLANKHYIKAGCPATISASNIDSYIEYLNNLPDQGKISAVDVSLINREITVPLKQIVAACQSFLYDPSTEKELDESLLNSVFNIIQLNRSADLYVNTLITGHNQQAAELSTEQKLVFANTLLHLSMQNTVAINEKIRVLSEDFEGFEKVCKFVIK